MELKVFKFYPVSPNRIEQAWVDIKREYPDAIFEQVIINKDDTGYVLAFI